MYEDEKANDKVHFGAKLPSQFFPSPLNPSGQGPQLMVSPFSKHVTFEKQASSVQFVIVTLQLGPVKPT